MQRWTGDRWVSTLHRVVGTEQGLKVLDLVPTFRQARAADTTSLGRSLEGLGQKQGWVLEESLRVYEGNGLYELVDGGATLYLEYGFVRAFALRFARGQSRISVELYQMSGTEAAYGIFSYLAAGSISAPAACGGSSPSARTTNASPTSARGAG